MVAGRPARGGHGRCHDGGRRAERRVDRAGGQRCGPPRDRRCPCRGPHRVFARRTPASLRGTGRRGRAPRGAGRRGRAARHLPDRALRDERPQALARRHARGVRVRPPRDAGSLDRGDGRRRADAVRGDRRARDRAAVVAGRHPYRVLDRSGRRRAGVGEVGGRRHGAPARGVAGARRPATLVTRRVHHRGSLRTRVELAGHLGRFRHRNAPSRHDGRRRTADGLEPGWRRHLLCRRRPVGGGTLCRARRRRTRRAPWLRPAAHRHCRQPKGRRDRLHDDVAGRRGAGGDRLGWRAASPHPGGDRRARASAVVTVRRSHRGAAVRHRRGRARPGWSPWRTEHGAA